MAESISESWVVDDGGGSLRVQTGTQEPSNAISLAPYDQSTGLLEQAEWLKLDGSLVVVDETAKANYIQKKIDEASAEQQAKLDMQADLEEFRALKTRLNGLTSDDLSTSEKVKDTIIDLLSAIKYIGKRL